MTTLSDTTLTSDMVKQESFTLEGNMRIYRPRDLVGIDSPPEDYLPDTLTLGPRLPAGWDGDAWTSPDETAYFLRAWNKCLACYAIGRGNRFEDARTALMGEIQQGGRPVELTATHTAKS